MPRALLFFTPRRRTTLIAIDLVSGNFFDSFTLLDGPSKRFAAMPNCRNFIPTLFP